MWPLRTMNCSCMETLRKLIIYYIEGFPVLPQDQEYLQGRGGGGVGYTKNF